MTDKHGIHFAHKISGNVSVKETFRYTKSSADELTTRVKNIMRLVDLEKPFKLSY